ncbi:MAG TPA: hypothetical protein VKE24_11540, partial [Candidatus Acidoferrales bacterium]|nr:hypothetical protein [Candidatus Acidoferrales bacterium]
MGKLGSELSASNLARRVLLTILLLAVALGSASAQSQPQGPPAFASVPSHPNLDGVGPNGVRAGHILVRFKASSSQEVLNQLDADFGAKVVGTIAGIRVKHLHVAGSGLALLDHLRGRPDVEFAEFDSVV